MQKEYYEVLLIIGLCCLITFGIRLIPFVFNITAGEQIDSDIMTTFFPVRS